MAKETVKRKSGLGKYFAQGGFDIPFLMLVLILLTIGLIMLFSSSYTYAYYHENGDSAYYFKNQLQFAVLGLVAMFFVSKIKYEYYKLGALLGLAISILLLIVVLFVTPPTKELAEQGFKRWITIPGVTTFQPSEIAKMALILFFAWHMDKNYDKVRKNDMAMVPYILIILLITGLIYLENHVSGAVLMLAIGIAMMFLGGVRMRWFVIGSIAVITVAAIVILKPDILPGHASVRITSWLDKEADPQGVRWQINQSLYAIGSGGFLGAGLGNSKQKHLYVSEPQNDFIFSIVCEELGFVGATVIIILFALLIWRGFVIAMKAKDRFGALLAMGLVFQVGLQAALNIAVVTDTIPNTGISLPFFSYGGTSLVILLVEMGMVLAVSRYSRISKR